jgi:hypothetical protein
MFYDVFCDDYVHTTVAWICLCCSGSVWWCSRSVHVMFYNVFCDVRIVYTWCSMAVAWRKVYISGTWNIANPIIYIMHGAQRVRKCFRHDNLYAFYMTQEHAHAGSWWHGIRSCYGFVAWPACTHVPRPYACGSEWRRRRLCHRTFLSPRIYIKLCLPIDTTTITSDIHEISTCLLWHHMC